MNFEIAVIGGGVVGTACFNKLVRLGKSVVLLEKENDVGFGSSKANSGLIHAGFDCVPSTLKAKLNVRGNEMFPSVAERLSVPFVQKGHLVVGNDLEKLQELKCRGEQNGVKGLKILNKTTLQKMEPNLSKDLNYALFAPTGGEISSYELSVAFAEEGIVNGGSVLLEFDTKSAKKTKSGIELTAKDGRKVTCLRVINSAGAGYNHIAKILKTEEYPIEFRRGEYVILDHSCAGFVNHTIFPLPDEKSKGILLTQTPHGNLLVGPTSYPSDETTKTTSEGQFLVKTQVSKLSDKIPYKNTIRNFSGVRNIVGKDFVIEQSVLDPRVINLAGICSPGLTASPAIAEMVATLLGFDASAEKKNLKKRKGYAWFRNLSDQEKNKIIAKDPDFGKMVCRCEGVTKGEIKYALHSPLPAKSVDAIKRRTRAGMGRCQGGFCLFQVMEELAKENGGNEFEVNKDSVGSQIYKCYIKENKGKKLL